jgi:hypothetical protein
MTTKLFSILASVILMAGTNAASAAPTLLSSNQMDAVTAGGTVWVTATASASGYYPASSTQVGTVVTTGGSTGGYAVAWSFGSSGTNASTSGNATGNVIATTYSLSGTQSLHLGALSYSVTTAASY